MARWPNRARVSADPPDGEPLQSVERLGYPAASTEQRRAWCIPWQRLPIGLYRRERIGNGAATADRLLPKPRSQVRCLSGTFHAHRVSRQSLVTSRSAGAISNWRGPVVHYACWRLPTHPLSMCPGTMSIVRSAWMLVEVHCVSGKGRLGIGHWLMAPLVSSAWGGVTLSLFRAQRS